jgi:hypothetical protein
MNLFDLVNSNVLFVIINFFVAVFSDLILNFLSSNYGSRFHKSAIIKSLQKYFKKRSILKAAFDAGLTVVVVLLLCMIFSFFLLGFAVPNNTFQLIQFIIVCFIFGYITDVKIEEWKIFGDDLDKYYKVAGAGFWGALALVFSVVISYLKQKIILPEFIKIWREIQLKIEYLN